MAAEVSAGAKLYQVQVIVDVERVGRDLLERGGIKTQDIHLLNQICMFKFFR
jgi:hypothetical protein